MKKTEIVERILNGWTAFPNNGIAGRYEFLTQLVYASSLEIQDFQDLRIENIELTKKVFGVILHELTHWLDHTSTLWGQKFLLKVFNAYTAKEYEIIDELWRLQEVQLELNRINFSNYYTVEGVAANTQWDGNPWSYDMTCGLQFNREGRASERHPLIFMRFFNSSNELIKRVPLSIVSLLETSATAAELKLEMLLLSTMDEDDRLIESSLVKERFLARIYNPEFTVYSVAAHCFANISGIDDILNAYEKASALATFCLNLPPQLFNALNVPSSITDLVGDRAKYLLSSSNYGFAFYLLSHYGSRRDDLDIANWLQETITEAGLPPLHDIKQIVLQEMENLEQQILRSPVVSQFLEMGVGIDKWIQPEPNIDTLLRIGKHNFQKRGIYGDHDILMESVFPSSKDKELKIPPILLGDDEVIQLGDSAIEISSDDFVNWIDYVWRMETQIKEFHNACVI